MQIFDGNNVDFFEGQLIVVNKPLGWTSFDVVNKIRHLSCKQYKVDKLRVGHAGTLDPMATGVLLICTGKYTKSIDLLQDGNKEYIASLKFGVTTPSYDSETEEDESFAWEHITRTLFEEKLLQFTGDIEQIPPLFSAVKLDGKRAYKIARKGRNPEVKTRNVRIDSIAIEHFEMPFVTIRVKCSKGTYIRALVRDIGEALGSGAYLTRLIRTRSGNYSLENALDIDEIENIIRNL